MYKCVFPQDKLGEARCNFCNPIKLPWHIYDDKGYTCQQCRKTLPRQSFTLPQQHKKQLSAWKCQNCQFPPCSKCGARPEKAVPQKPKGDKKKTQPYTCRACQGASSPAGKRRAAKP